MSGGGTMREYLLWSYRNRQWWRANASGYTPDPQQAGKYDAREASAHALSGLPGGTLPVDADLCDHFNSDPEETEAVLERWRRL